MYRSAVDSVLEPIDVEEPPYPIIHVPIDAAHAQEQMGSKAKFWYFEDDGSRWMFKVARQGTGEDWAEKVAAELADLLSLPHAHYELAEYGGNSGVVTKSFVPEGSPLLHGNEILSELDPSYPNPQNAQTRFTRVPQHTIERLVQANKLVDLVRPPMNWKPTFDVESAADVLVGYLLLDAWIGNTDRHHENWGWIGMRDDEGMPSHICLAPTFDHASSLGRNESDQRRRQRLDSRDRGFNLKAYVEKCVSAFYAQDDAPSPLTTYEAFLEIGRRCKVGGNVWLMVLEGVSDEEVERVFRRIPRSRISDVAIEFALGILKMNKARLLRWSQKL